MKRDELKALELTDEQIDSIMKLHGKTVESKKAELDALTTKVTAYEQQINDTSAKLKEFESLDVEQIKKATTDLQSKYDTDTQQLKEQLAKQEYTFKAKEYLNGYKYANDLTKEAVENKFLAKDFKLEDGKFLGADDFIKQLQESQPTAFQTETKNTPNFGSQASKEGNSNPEDDFEKAFRGALGI